MIRTNAMRIPRALVPSTLCVVLLANLAAAAEEARDYAKELRQAQSHQHAKRYKDCLRACEKMLGHYKESSQAKEVTWLKMETQVLDGQLEGALKTLADLARAEADDPKLQMAVALRTGDVQRLVRRFEDAVATYRKAADAGAKDEPDQAAEALLRAGDVFSTDLKKPEQAIAQYREIEAKLGAQQPKQAAEALRRIAAALWEMKKVPEARAEYQRLICACPLDQAACQAAQSRIVESYRAESKWAEALGAARILYDAAGSEQGIRDAAQAVAQAFLAADGNLSRANEFLAYQSFGPDGPDGKPNTPDDIAANRLAEVKYPPFSAEASKQFEAAVKAQPETYDGYRTKAFLYIYWGKPKEGAGQFLLAFKAASLAQVPAAAQDLILIGMKASTASFRGLDRIFEYLSYGPKGKSGKENIPDPFAGL